MSGLLKLFELYVRTNIDLYASTEIRCQSGDSADINDATIVFVTKLLKDFLSRSQRVLAVPLTWPQKLSDVNAKHSGSNILLSFSARVKILELLADDAIWHLSRLLSWEVASDATRTLVLLMALDRHQSRFWVTLFLGCSCPQFFFKTSKYTWVLQVTVGLCWARWCHTISLLVPTKTEKYVDAKNWLAVHWNKIFHCLLGVIDGNSWKFCQSLPGLWLKIAILCEESICLALYHSL